MEYAFELRPQTHVQGLFVVQEKKNLSQFKRLARHFYHPTRFQTLCRDYKEVEAQAFCITRGTQEQWLICIFATEPEVIRRHALHEISHLAGHLTFDEETRARFLQYAYFAFSDDLEARQ